MSWGAVWQFILTILRENPDLLAQIIKAILEGIKRDPDAAAAILNGLILKK